MLPILEGAVRDLQGSNAETKRQQVEAEQGRLAIELARLMEAIAAGGGVSLVGAVNAREAQLETLRGELRALDQLTQVGRLDRIQLERTARECLTDWQGLLAGMATAYLKRAGPVGATIALVSRRNCPPSRMVSRAFRARSSISCSIWLASAWTCGPNRQAVGFAPWNGPAGAETPLVQQCSVWCNRLLV